MQSVLCMSTGLQVTSLLFADDVLLRSSQMDLQHAFEFYAAECKVAGMKSPKP